MQKRACAGAVAPQAAQRHSSREPQLMQKRAPAGLSVLQLGHVAACIAATVAARRRVR
jgi:hypothetical protein